MTMQLDRDPIAAIDSTTLQTLIHTLLEDTTAQLLDWQAEPVYGGAATNTALYRVIGHAAVQGAAITWSLILKIFRIRGRVDDPRRWNYWKREPLAYQSGLLKQLPGGVIAPRCFGAVEQSDGEVWLWLEDVAALGRQHWSLSDFGRAARQLGRFNGAYLAGRAQPSYPWLSQGRLRGWVALCADAVAALPSNLRHPLVRARFSDAAVGQLLQLWAEREAFLGALDRLPRVLGHLDAFPRNLLVCSDASGDHLMAIDWASVGFGAVGEELAPLVAASLIFFEADMSTANELDAVAYAGYIEGLREAGARLDEAAVRFGYAAVACLRYGLGIALDIGIAADEQHHDWATQVLGQSVEAMVARDAAVAEFLSKHIAEARDLLPNHQN